MERTFITPGGMRLEAATWGAPRSGRPTLVFLHEGLGSVSLWRDFPQRVAEATGLPAFAYSRRGYGASDGILPPRPLDVLEREAALLPAVLAAAGLGPVLLVGHSDGASIALLHAAAGPAALLGVVAMAPHSFVEDVTVQSIAAAADAYRAGPLRDRLARHHGANVDGAFWGWNRVWLDPGFRDWDIRPKLAAIGVPVLVIQGEDDEYGTAAQVEAIRAAVPAARSLLLPACGHSPHRDQPDAAVAAVAAFAAEYGR